MKFTWTVMVVLAVTVRAAAAQTTEQPPPQDVDRLRTESGIDPTRVQSRAAFSVLVQDLPADAGQATMRGSLVLGVNHWSLTLKGDVVSQQTGQDGTGFRTGAGDFRFSALNAVYVKGRHAVAVSGEMILPTAGPGLGASYTALTPSVSYSFTLNPSLFLAVQPQYTFDLFKDAAAPDLRVFTTRAFLAKFTSAGYFYVFEWRPVFDYANDTADLMLSPIVGKAIGAGFNLLALVEFPTSSSAKAQRGNLYQVGLQKAF